ncbi:MAG: hypothetical protein AAF211_20500 [Myxococcota bacterium]
MACRLRSRLIEGLFTVSYALYARLRPRPRWGLRARQLAAFPAGTLGHALGSYLLERGFELIDGRESHDVFHLLTQIPNDAVSEVCLQWWLLGNGKRSPYLLGAVLLGAVVFPEHLTRFVREWQRGRRHAPVHRIDWRPRLGHPLPEFSSRPPRSVLTGKPSEMRGSGSTGMGLRVLKSPSRRIRGGA